MWKKDKITVAIEVEIGSKKGPRIKKFSSLKKALQYGIRRGAISITVQNDEDNKRHYISIAGVLHRRDLLNSIRATEESTLPPGTLRQLFNNIVRDQERQLAYNTARTLSDVFDLIEKEYYDSRFIKTVGRGFVQIEEDAIVVNSLGHKIWPKNDMPRLRGRFDL